MRPPVKPIRKWFPVCKGDIYYGHATDTRADCIAEFWGVYDGIIHPEAVAAGWTVRRLLISEPPKKRKEKR